VTDAQIREVGPRRRHYNNCLPMRDDVITLLQQVTLDTDVYFLTIVEFITSLDTVMMSSPLMSVRTHALTREWTYFHEIWYGRCAIGAWFKIVIFHFLHSLL
jgi:hypothetical protein